MSRYIGHDLGSRRRAFRIMKGECGFDFRCRKLMERQERRAKTSGTVIWSRSMGPFDKEWYGLMYAKEEEKHNG